jgi:hypothetical protein
MLLINVYYGDEILNTPMDVDYTIVAIYTIIVFGYINFRNIKKHVQAGLDLVPSQYKFIIKAQINTS